MARLTITQAQVDYSAPLVLELNEITVLMGVSAVGIIAVILLSVFAAVTSVFGKNAEDMSDKHYSRN